MLIVFLNCLCNELIEVLVVLWFVLWVNVFDFWLFMWFIRIVMDEKEF